MHLVNDLMITGACCRLIIIQVDYLFNNNNIMILF